MIDFFVSIWIEVVYKPVYNLVVFSYNLTPGPSLGIAIIGIAILIRFVFLYFTLRSYKQDKVLEKVKPQMEQIEEDSKLTSREKYQKVAELTKPHGINPFYESVPIFAQVIFLIGLYQILQQGIQPSGYENLYDAVNAPQSINTMFLGFDLSSNFIVIPSLVAAGVMFLERIWEYNEKKTVGLQSLSQKWDPLILPTLSFIILLLLPSAKAVFVATSVSFSLAIKAIMHIGKPAKDVGGTG
jgi:YidC/Oxa1 family membrane protein insertase